MSKLSAIEAIGPILGERLESVGITSVEVLLEAGATPAGRRQISATAGIDADLVLEFVTKADLMRVEGISGEHAELLVASGVDSVRELSLCNPKHLADRLKEQNAEEDPVRAGPSAITVIRWVDQAKTLQHIVQS